MPDPMQPPAPCPAQHSVLYFALYLRVRPVRCRRMWPYSPPVWCRLPHHIQQRATTQQALRPCGQSQHDPGLLGLCLHQCGARALHQCGGRGQPHLSGGTSLRTRLGGRRGTALRHASPLHTQTHPRPRAGQTARTCCCHGPLRSITPWRGRPVHAPSTGV